MKSPRLVVFVLLFIIGQGGASSTGRTSRQACRAKYRPDAPAQSTLTNGTESQNGPAEVDDTPAIPALPKIADISCDDVLNILVPDWDISCGDNSVDSSALTAISSNFLADINLNWTTLGLEDAFLEAVKYVYDNHLGTFVCRWQAGEAHRPRLLLYPR
jgi:hypothetical protein